MQPQTKRVPVRPEFDVSRHQNILQQLSNGLQDTMWKCTNCSYCNATAVAFCGKCSKHRLTNQFLKITPNKYGGSLLKYIFIYIIISFRPSGLQNVAVHKEISSISSSGNDFAPIPMNSLTICKTKSWTCNVCKLPNSLSTNVCTGCYSKKQIEDGTFEKLFDVPLSKTNSNKKSKGKPIRDLKTAIRNALGIETEKTETPLIKDTLTSKEDLSGWVCKTCKFKNIPCTIVCQMCKTMQDEKESSASLNYEERAHMQWNYLVSQCKADKKLYIDSSFPPDDASLYYEPQSQVNLIPIKWVRFRNTIPQDQDKNAPWIIFPDILKATDVTQGELGDCWFISSLTVLVEREDIIRKAILTQQLCSEGVYQVRICKDGIWTIITVDDLFPCFENSMLCYAQANGKQLWAPLIEKAAAKMFGCYEALTTGSIIHGLAILTGAACETINLQSCSNTDQLWAKLISAHEAKFLIGALCDGNAINGRSEEMKEMELFDYHEYAILNVAVVESVKLLQLRDPYGMFGGLEKRKFFSPKWSVQVQAKLLASYSCGEGVFWIDYDDFLTYFKSAGICRVRNNWHEARFRGLFATADVEKVQCFEIEVNSFLEIDIMLYQSNQRHLQSSQRRKMDICVAVLEHMNGEYKFIASSEKKIEEFVSLNVNLTSGKFLIVPFSFNCWLAKDNFEPRFVLALSCPKITQVEKVTKSKIILARIISQLALRCALPLNYCDGNCVAYSLTQNFCGTAYVAENWFKNKWVRFTCKGKCRNIIPTRNATKIVDLIPPMHRQVIGVFSPTEQEINFEFCHTIEFELIKGQDAKDCKTSGRLHIPSITNDEFHVPFLIE